MLQFRLGTFPTVAALLMLGTAGCGSPTFASPPRGLATPTVPAAPSAADTAAVLRTAAELVVFEEQALRLWLRTDTSRRIPPDSLRARAGAFTDEPLAIGEMNPPAAAGAREAAHQLRSLARPGPDARELRLHLVALGADSAAVRETRFSPCPATGGSFYGPQRTLHFARRDGTWVFVGERDAMYVHGRCAPVARGAA